MTKKRILFMLLAVICLMAVSVVGISAEKNSISVRRIEQQVVLYTINRGSYAQTGSAIGKLYALAGRNRITPRGSAYYVYLNNPNQVSSEHWLTEVRIPVGKDALKLAGSLGPMTDIKLLPAMEVAVAVKPEGQADPSGIYNRLYAWIFKEGYIAAGACREVFLTNAMSGNYARMKTEIIIPVRKFQPDKDY